MSPASSRSRQAWVLSLDPQELLGQGAATELRQAGKLQVKPLALLFEIEVIRRRALHIV